MGCDIHGPWIEQQQSDHTWDLVAQMEVRRDYNLFSKLAGVRAYDGRTAPGPYQPRGYPAGLSYQVRGKTHKSGRPLVDFHSASWLLTSELLEVAKLAKSGWPLFWHATMLAAEREFKQPCRIVFCFDN